MAYVDDSLIKTLVLNTVENERAKIKRSTKHCRLCRQHGISTRCSQHSCPYQQCTCAKCTLVLQQREVMSKQMFFRRNEHKQARVNNMKSPWNVNSYSCQRCRNHGLCVPKKDHTPFCPFIYCSCELCVIAMERSNAECKIRNNCLMQVKKAVTPVNLSEENVGCESLPDVLKDERKSGSATARDLRPRQIIENLPASKISPPSLGNNLPTTPGASLSQATQLFLTAQARQPSSTNHRNLPSNSELYSSLQARLPAPANSTLPRNNFFNSVLPLSNPVFSSHPQLAQTQTLSRDAALSQELNATSSFTLNNVSPLIQSIPQIDIPQKPGVNNLSFDQGQAQAYISYNTPPCNPTQLRYLPTIPPSFFNPSNDKFLLQNSDSASLNYMPAYSTFLPISQINTLNSQVSQSNLGQSETGSDQDFFKLNTTYFTHSLPQPFTNSGREERRQFVPFLVAYIPI